MKKVLSVMFAMTIAFTMSATPVLAKTGNGKSAVAANSKDSKENKSVAPSKDNAKQEDNLKQDNIKQDNTKESNPKSNKPENKKVFKNELNEQKKELQQEKGSLNQQLENLQSQYDAMLVAGDVEGAEALLESISVLNEQIQGVQSQIKETINERYMLVKTMYSDEELAQFSNASEVISQMHADAEVLSEGCVTINNNLIKFDTPAYIKGGVTLVPLRAITEGLGGEVSWDEETQSVTITKGDTTVEITANSTTAIINGETVEISIPATENCGRTYVPIRFLSEALGFNTEWDSENELIDINDGTEMSDDDEIETSDEDEVEASDEDEIETSDEDEMETSDEDEVEASDEDEVEASDEDEIETPETEPEV